jgi:hypothetical protein
MMLILYERSGIHKAHLIHLEKSMKSKSSKKTSSSKAKKALPNVTWSKSDARLFQLFSVGLHGRKFSKGSDGIKECFDDLDVVQLDALPLMGRNHDLVIQSRVDGTHPGQFLDLMHEDRFGFEYWDKVYCAVPLKHFPMLRTYMKSNHGLWHLRRKKMVEDHAPKALKKIYKTIEEKGPLSSREITDFGAIPAYNTGWKPPKITSMALDVLWNEGDISTTHRVNYRKYFDITERVLPKKLQNQKPMTGDVFWKTWLKKRVNNVGLLPLRGDNESWAFVKQAKKLGLIDAMIEKGELTLINVDDIKIPFLALGDAEAQLKQAQKINLSRRARFIAPLDQLIWCRQGISELWDFEYRWEVYKPVKQRRWGYYVLPVLYQDRFVGRFDGKYDTKSGAFNVIAYHEEPNGLPITHSAVEAAFSRFLRYLGGDEIKLPIKRK